MHLYARHFVEKLRKRLVQNEMSLAVANFLESIPDSWNLTDNRNIDSVINKPRYVVHHQELVSGIPHVKLRTYFTASGITIVSQRWGGSDLESTSKLFENKYKELSRDKYRGPIMWGIHLQKLSEVGDIELIQVYIAGDGSKDLFICPWFIEPDKIDSFWANEKFKNLERNFIQKLRTCDIVREEVGQVTILHY